MALTYQLTDPNFTIYHRAALGGLAATIQAWGDKQPEGIQAKVETESVEITWDDTITDQEALSHILNASFKRTDDGIVELPGQFIGEDRIDLRFAVHEGLCCTFLHKGKDARWGPKEAKSIELYIEGEEEASRFTYKAIDGYAHQKAKGTNLFKELSGTFPKIVRIPQWVIPGAMTGKKELQAKPEEAILLLYLMVGCVVFLLRPRTYKEKAQACIVVPDVTNLLDFADSMQILTSSNQNVQRFSNTYLGRVVGGAEEAALSFLIDINAKSVTGCQAIAMGKVAWDKNQVNRSISVKLHRDYSEMKVFRAAKQYLGRSKRLRTSAGKSFVVPSNPVPELVAANLASDRHWCAHFKDLVSQKKDFKQMSFHRRGINQMVSAIKDEDDKAIIRAFHKAWEMTMGRIGERADKDKLNFSRLVEVRREKIRNEILRTKTSTALAGWFLQFCTDATKGASLTPIREDAERIRALIFNPRHFDRFQNLLLFALLSYEGDGTKAQSTSNTKK
jgi:CRISPR-associated protein Cas8a1/Csx13